MAITKQLKVRIGYKDYIVSPEDVKFLLQLSLSAQEIKREGYKGPYFSTTEMDSIPLVSDIEIISYEDETDLSHESL